MTEKITVYFPVWAEYSIQVEVSDDGDRDEAISDAIDAAYDKLPSGLCHQCAHGNDGRGFFDTHDVYLELGDQPEAKFATGADNTVVWGDADAKTEF
jgi:hypothetical protein